jgi:hypothetical protein
MDGWIDEKKAREVKYCDMTPKNQNCGARRGVCL